MGFKVENRKEAVKAMERMLSMRSKYMGPPTFAYVVGDFTVDRDGNVECPDAEQLEEMKLKLQAEGLGNGEVRRTEVEIPAQTMTEDALRNLINMIHSKQYLLEKALGYRAFNIPDALVEAVAEKGVDIPTAIAQHSPTGITVGGGRINITGFPDNGFDVLAKAMIESASAHRWITPDETIAENEKYYMRAWLVRLGFDGKNGKEIRRMLLKNLKGHSAFRTEADAAKWKEKHG